MNILDLTLFYKLIINTYLVRGLISPYLLVFENIIFYYLNGIEPQRLQQRLG
jgi:hypothetical protein